MNKKRLVKIAACSLLIGSIALVGCKKKTKDKTTKPITTKQGRRAISYTVFIDGEKYSKDNNTIKFEYKDGYDYISHIKLIAHFNDDTEEEIGSNHYETISNLNEDSGIGKYVLTVIYEDLEPVSIFLEVNPLVLDFSNTRWNIDEVTYNGKEQEAKLFNLPTGIPNDMLIYKANKQTYVGNYTSSVTVVENTNYQIINFDASLYSHNWTINKLQVDVSNLNWDYENPFTYDEKEKEIKLVGLPDGVEVEYSDNKKVNAGTYIAKATFIQNNNVETTPEYLEKEFTILKKQINFSNTYWDDKKNYVYNKENQTLELADIPRLTSEVTISVSDNVKKDAGTYVAKLTVNASDNYEVVGLSDDLKNHTWTIAKAKVKFYEIHAENKVYDGYSSTISYKTNLDLTPDVFYYKNVDDDDSEYSTSIPSDAGAYTVKVVINNTSNYDGASVTCNYVIAKKLVSWPKSNVDNYPYICITCGSERESVYIPLIGFDENIMRFTDDSNSPTQAEFGVYTYKVELKDQIKKNYIWDDSTKPGADEYTWFINNNANGCVPMVKYNDKRVGVDMPTVDFETIEYFHPGDTLEFDAGEHGPNVVHINGHDYSLGKYTVGESGIFEIEIINNDRRVYYRVCKISNEFGINEIKINDINYYYDGNDFSYNLGNNQKIDIEFKIDKSSIKSLIVNNVDIDLDNPKITLEEFGSTINVTYLCYDPNKNGCFIINVIKDSVIKSFDVIAVNPSDSTPLAVNYNMDKHPESFEITLSKKLIYDIDINYYNNSIARGYTYKIIDTDTNMIADFSKIKSIYHLEIQLFDGDGNFKEKIEKITIKLDELVYKSFECVTNKETKEKQFVKCISDTNSVTLEVKDSLYTNLDIYHDSEKTNVITYDNFGVYREKIVFKKKICGINYNLTNYIDIVYSEKISTYADVYYSYKGGNKVYNGQNDLNNNVLAYDIDGNQEMIGIHDLLNVEIDDIICSLKDTSDSYHYELSEIEFLDEHNKNLVRFVIKLVFHDGDEGSSVLHTLYLITYYSGTYSDNTGVVGEKAVETYYIDSSHIKDINIENNNMTIDNTSPLYSYDFELETASNVCLKQSSSKTPIYEEEGTTKFSISFSQEGEYKLTITAVTGATRDIFIHVSGNFGNVFETQIGDGTKIYISPTLDTNMSTYDDESGTIEYLVGFYGNDSISQVSDNKVEVKISGSITDYIFKDVTLSTPITTPTDTLDVLKDNYDNSYVELFMEDKYIRLYLSDKPDNDLTISVGGSNYGLIYKNGYSYYGDLDTSSGNFYVKPNGFSNSLTITTRKIYDDYSYSIIIVDSVDEFDEYTSYSEMETKQKLFRVKDSDTLTREFTNFDSRLIYILPLGTTDDVYNPKKNAHPLIIDMPIYYFNIIAFDNDSYYFGYDISGNEITNSYSSDYESGEFRFKVGSDKGSSTEGKYITFDLETTYLYNDDLFYRDTDLGKDVKCYDEATNTFKVKHNTDQGSVIIFFTEDHSRFVILEFVDRID